MKKLLLFSGIFCFMIFMMSACSKEEPQSNTETGELSEVVKQKPEQSVIESSQEDVGSGIQMGEEAYEEAEKDIRSGIETGMDALEDAEKDVKSGMEMGTESYEAGKERMDIE